MLTVSQLESKELIEIKFSDRLLLLCLIIKLFTYLLVSHNIYKVKSDAHNKSKYEILAFQSYHKFTKTDNNAWEYHLSECKSETWTLFDCLSIWIDRWRESQVQSSYWLAHISLSEWLNNITTSRQYKQTEVKILSRKLSIKVSLANRFLVSLAFHFSWIPRQNRAFQCTTQCKRLAS